MITALLPNLDTPESNLGKRKKISYWYDDI